MWTQLRERHAPAHEKIRLTPKLNTHTPLAASSADVSAHSSIIAAVERATTMTLSTRVGWCRLCLAVDTGSSENVTSEEAYKAMKRNSRGGACILLTNDMNLAGVTCSRLNILCTVFATNVLRKHIDFQSGFLCNLRLYAYIGEFVWITVPVLSRARHLSSVSLSAGLWTSLCSNEPN